MKPISFVDLPIADRDFPVRYVSLPGVSSRLWPQSTLPRWFPKSSPERGCYAAMRLDIGGAPVLTYLT